MTRGFICGQTNRITARGPSSEVVQNKFEHLQQAKLISVNYTVYFNVAVMCAVMLMQMAGVWCLLKAPPASEALEHGWAACWWKPGQQQEPL